MTAGKSTVLEPIRLSANYVLILEWLELGDRPTGANLHRRLKARGLDARLAPCNCAQDVRNALSVALAEITNDGVPIVHIESHGDSPKYAPMRERAFGARNEEISWTDLGSYLSPLNRASDFNVLLVGAACWGLSAVASLRLHSYAPFVGCIGFSTSVNEHSLEDAISELYRCLLVEKQEIGIAVEAARRELHSNAEALDFTTSARLAKMTARNFYKNIMSAESFDDIASVLECLSSLSESEGRALATIDWRAFRVKLAQQKIEGVWEEWFPSAIQQRASVYRLDWQSFVDEAPG